MERQLNRLNDELRPMLGRMLAVMRTDPLPMVHASYMLGKKVAREASKAELSTDEELEVLYGIANGDQTLHHSGAEIRQQFPNGPSDIECVRKENQRVDQIIAHLIFEFYAKCRQLKSG